MCRTISDPLAIWQAIYSANAISDLPMQDVIKNVINKSGARKKAVQLSFQLRILSFWMILATAFVLKASVCIAAVAMWWSEIFWRSSSRDPSRPAFPVNCGFNVCGILNAVRFVGLDRFTHRGK